MRDVRPQYVSVKDFATMTGYSEQTIRLWCRSGLLPNLRVGHRWLIDLDRLDSAEENAS